MKKARIYQPSKTSMQSGKAKIKHWIFEFNVSDARFKEPVMGWTGTTDTLGQLKLKFQTLEGAISFAKRCGVDFLVEQPHDRKLQIRAYSDNFRYDKVI